MKKNRRRSRKGKGATFDPQNETLVEHRQLGVWDLYIERDPKLSLFPILWKIEEYVGMWNDLPYLLRTIRDVGTIAWPLLLLYVCSRFYGHLLDIVQSAVDNRTVDAHFLIQIAGGRVLCAVADHLLHYAGKRVSTSLNGRIKRFYSAHIFHAMARLDVPTWDDPVVSAQIDALVPRGENTVPWVAIMNLVNTGSTLLRMFSQTAVLFGILREQSDGLLLCLLSFASDATSFFSFSNGINVRGAWAATTHDEDFIRMEGLKRLISRSTHRKELVAGGLTEYLTAEYRGLVDRLGDRASDFWSIYTNSFTYDALQPMRLLRLPLGELPQIVFTLRAVQQPMSIPVSLASLHLMQRASGLFMGSVRTLLEQTGNMSERLSALRQLYEAGNIANNVADGTTPFPENEQSIRDGIAIEFRNVSFRYPGSEDYALRDISFRVHPGQLCVIIGSNGSGKSTILKLVARIYDPTEGTILIDGHDIKTLRLADVRRALAILFQDYTHFPLSVRENIALGDPSRAHDDAANGFDTYLERPVRDIYSGIPDGTTNARLAVARTFMRSSSTERGVGLLLFDEPSASLDPTAEHDLFSRLRELRGSKTMIFSTHRFGNLTRHADLILYMNDSLIVEAGTHEELLNRKGSDYAWLWRMQAQAFL
ncbi:HlyB/MsbA family ABC transporter [Lactarius sanguifluus]|nr:HlyB/MsbA family ABC transporter [Lactarius sanguifluus]